MCSANEVTLVDTMYGANLGTCATALTLCVIDSGKVVYYRDSAAWAGLLALTATDTAVGAGLTCYSALIVAGAFNNNA